MTEDESIQLDLGLAALMAEPPSEPAKVSLPTETVESAPVSSEIPEEHVAKSPFEVFADQGDWEGLCKYTEAALEEPAVAGCEAKLWWLRAQYELKAMPLSILVAPFESLLERIEDLLSDDSTAFAVGSLLPHVAELLRIFQKGGLDTSLGNVLKTHLARDHASSLPEEAESATLTLKDLPISTERSAVKETSSGQTRASSGRPLFLKWGVGLFICLLGVFIYWSTQSYLSSPSPSIRPPDLILASAAPLLASPVSDRIGRVSQLDAVLYDAENSETRDNSTDGAAAASSGNSAGPVEEQPVQSKTDPVPSAGPSKQVAKASQAEVVDTSGPVEPEGLFEERSPRPSASGNFGAGRDPIDNQTMTVRGAQLFRVLVRTEVLAKPTFTADRIGFLQVGDEIEVERSEGPWLQVRSRMGRVGFVISQDVVPLR